MFSSSFLVMRFIARFTWMVIWVVLRFGLIANKETVNGCVLIFVWTQVPFLSGRHLGVALLGHVCMYLFKDVP